MDPPAPTPTPDPVKTAAAQAASNKETAIAQANLNNYDKVSPDGSQTYQVIGTNADGTPKYQQTTTLSASNQGIYDTNQATKTNIATIGKDQSAKIGTLLGTPFKVDSAISDRLVGLGKTRLDPQWAANDEKQAASLANQGITPGSPAYDNAMRSYNAAKNDAYNSLYLNGNGQAMTESLAERNQPINEISALMSGSQVSTPTFSASPQTSVAGTDVAGITQNAYLDQNQQAQQAVAAQNAMMGGLFQLGGTAATAAIKYSDRRLKSRVELVGTGALGLPLYEYDIFGRRERGHMADEVAQVLPAAVMVGAFGIQRVNYSLLGVV
ncbi:tail fiber domain-containing protein [Bradyrhizobium oligotrophicum S58]